jgi:hypothetical protein
MPAAYPASGGAAILISRMDGQSLTWSGGNQYPDQTAFYWRGNIGGSIANTQPVVVNMFQADVFAVAASASTGNMRVYTNFGGASHTGTFLNFDSTFVVMGTTNNQPGTNKFYQAGNFGAFASVNDNGTLGSASGSINGCCDYAVLNGGATYWLNVNGHETDVSIRVGASANFLTGSSVVLLSTNAVAASIENLGFLVGAQQGATATLNCAYAVGGYQGYNPISSTGGVLKYIGHAGANSGPTIAYGVDLSLCTFTGNAYSSTGFAVSGNGDVSGKTFTPNSKPTVSGSRGGNAAVTSLLIALSAIGLITDATTA